MKRKTQDELQKEYNETLQKVSVGAYYRHFKNAEKLYQVVSVGFFENTEKPCVIYRALYGKGILWIRTLSDFLAEKEVDGKKVSRFTKI